MKHFKILLFFQISLFAGMLYATEGTPSNENQSVEKKEEGEQKTPDENQFKKLFTGDFSISNIAKKIKEQLTSPGFTSFIKYYGAYTAYSALIALTTILIHELGHALIAQRLGYQSSMVIGRPEPNENPLFTFYLGKVQVKFFPHLAGGSTKFSPVSAEGLQLTQSQDLGITIAGPLAGVFFNYAAMATLEIFNQLTNDSSLKNAILQGIKSPLIVRGAVIDYYKQWAFSLQEALDNKGFLSQAFYYLKAFIVPGPISFVRLMQFSHLITYNEQSYNLMPFISRIPSDGARIFELLGMEKALNVKLMKLTHKCMIIFKYSPHLIGLYQGLFGNFTAHLWQNYLFAYMTSTAYRASLILEKLKLSISSAKKKINELKKNIGRG